MMKKPDKAITVKNPMVAISNQQEQLPSLLKKAVDRSFLCEDSDMLKAGIDFASKLLSSLENGYSFKDGFLISDELPKHLQGKKPKRNLKRKRQPKGLTEYATLPKYKKPVQIHWKARGHFGRRADGYKYNYKVKVPLSTTQAKKNR